jgi:hypothetical protein
MPLLIGMNDQSVHHLTFVPNRNEQGIGERCAGLGERYIEYIGLSYETNRLLVYPHTIDAEADEVEHEVIRRLRSTNGDERKPLHVATAVRECEGEIIMKDIEAGLK